MNSTRVDPEQELAALCGVLNQSYARMVAIVADALSDESWANGGIRSPEHWLTMRAGLSPFHARQIVTVARRRDELPSVMGAFADGQLSLDQVTVIVRYTPAHVEASVAEFAVNASVPQLRSALSRYSFDPPTPPGHRPRVTAFDTEQGDAGAADTEPCDTEPCGTEPCDEEARDTDPGNETTGSGSTGGGSTCGGSSGNETPEDRVPADPPSWNGRALEEDRSGAPAELSMSQDQYGRFILRFTAPADMGALVEASLTEAKDALFRAGRPDVTLGDAMVEMARRSMGAVESPHRRDAFRTYVHLDTNGGWLTGKPRLPRHIATKLICDGILQPVWHSQGAPVNVGRAQRIVPTRTRRLVEDRDRGCRYPGCNATAQVECHHITHWIDGGPTDTRNLASLCPFHHDAHHAGDFTISGNADDRSGLTFTTRDGFPIRPGPTFTTPTVTTASTTTDPPPEPPEPPEPAPPRTYYRGPTGESLDLRYVSFGEPRDLALC